jgi:RNA polymerase sigma-70 factor, ECF subfamily
VIRGATHTHRVTLLLQDWSRGNPDALEELAPLVQGELHRLAQRYMGRERRGHLLQATALINEVYLRLVEWRRVRWQDRAHFFGVSARLMRRVLVDHARRQQFQKRGGRAVTVSFDEVAILSPDRGTDVVAIDDALKALATFDARKSEIVELRFFGGLSVQETAEVLKISPRTVKREWSMARAWLYSELNPKNVDGG